MEGRLDVLLFRANFVDSIHSKKLIFNVSVMSRSYQIAHLRLLYKISTISLLKTQSKPYANTL